MITFSIILPTHNRCADVRETLTALRKLKPAPLEIRVTADGCTDETVEVVRRNFPEVNLTVHSTVHGSVACRDQMMRAARGDWVVSLDDDSHPNDSDFLELLARQTGAHPEAAVIACTINEGPNSLNGLQRNPLPHPSFVARFGNGAAAFRREVYSKTQGFPAFFFHAHEESDYAAQCHGIGYGVWYAPELVIHHRISASNRDQMRTDVLNARNEFWSTWLRCPWPWVLFITLFRLTRQFQYACRRGWPWIFQQPRWWVQALRGIPTCILQRHPLPWRKYIAWVKLAKYPITDSSEWHAIFRDEKVHTSPTSEPTSQSAAS